MYLSINKDENIDLLNKYMLSKTLSMFEWENLPDSIPQKEIEKLLQVNGYAFITKVNGVLYALSGTLSGEQDAYGNYTKININNVYLNYNEELDIEKDGVLITNDDCLLGLLPYYEKQNSLLVENDINLRLYGINSRTRNLISAPDDASKQSAETYLKKIEGGELGVIGTNTLFDGVTVHSGSGGSNGSIKELLEYHQYLKSNLFNEVGLSSNFNMKRERLLSAEVDQSEDSLFPLVYNMLQCRLFAVERVNEMFNTDIDLDFGSVWHYKNKKLVDGVIENEQFQKTGLDQSSLDNSESDFSGDQKETEQDEERERTQGLDLDTVTDSVDDVENDSELESDELESDELESDELESDKVENDTENETEKNEPEQDEKKKPIQDSEIDDNEEKG